MDIITAKLGAKMAQEELKANGQVGYTEEVKTEAIPEQTIVVAMNEDLGAPLAIITPGYVFTGVAKVQVMWDGVEYVCVPAAEGHVGNQGFLGGEDTGEPFLYSYEAAAGFGFFAAAEGTHTVSMVAVSNVYHPMKSVYQEVVELTAEIPMSNTPTSGTVDLSAEEHEKLYALAQAGVPAAIKINFPEGKSDDTYLFSLAKLDNDKYHYHHRAVEVPNESALMVRGLTITLSPSSAAVEYKLNYFTVSG